MATLDVMADETKAVTFNTFSSLNAEFTKLAKEAWGCTKEEAISTAMLVFLEHYGLDFQNTLCSEYRAATSRQLLTGEPIQDVFRRISGKTGSRPAKVAAAIQKALHEGRDRHSEAQ
jgi:hypothetical protein